MAPSVVRFVVVGPREHLNSFVWTHYSDWCIATHALRKNVVANPAITNTRQTTLAEVCAAITPRAKTP